MGLIANQRLMRDEPTVGAGSAYGAGEIGTIGTSHLVILLSAAVGTVATRG